MSDMNRRDFLKIAGAGSAVLAAIGAGVVATGKVFRADPASSGPNDSSTPATPNARHIRARRSRHATPRATAIAASRMPTAPG